MKRFFVFVLVLCFVFPGAVSAKTSEYALGIVPESLVIDGVFSSGEWDGAVKISLTKDNTGMWADYYDERSRLPLYAYFYYGEQGIYVGADIYDNDVDTVKMHDCFEVAFDPGGFIPDGDRLEGLFFTFWLDGEKIRMKRHNHLNGEKVGIFEDSAECRYALTDHGYTVETLIRWEWLALPDRPVLDVKSGEYKTGVLDKFDYRDKGAFVKAIVCYLNGNGSDKAQYRCVYRTVTDPALAGNFSTATYDLKFTFDTEQKGDGTDVTAVNTPGSDTGTKTKRGRNTIPAAVCFAAAGVCLVAAVILIVLKRKKIRTQ